MLAAHNKSAFVYLCVSFVEYRRIGVEVVVQQLSSLFGTHTHWDMWGGQDHTIIVPKYLLLFAAIRTDRDPRWQRYVEEKINRPP